MGDFLEAHYKHSLRRGDSTVPPFYYPESSPSGPDIAFVLRIDDQLYPVFVQNKCLAGIHPGDVEKARLTVRETGLKGHLPNLATITKTSREGWDGEVPEIGTDHNQVFKDGDTPLMQLLMIIDGSNMRDLCLKEWWTCSIVWKVSSEYMISWTRLVRRTKNQC